MPTYPFISTPTNSDKNLSGWNSRYIYIHSSGGSIEVGESIDEGEFTEVFETINGEYSKGSVNLKAGYFNCDDGNTFKISMYFIVTLNGGTLRLGTGLKFSNGNQEFINTKNGVFHTLPTKTGVQKVCKYEVVLTKHKESVENTFLYVNGCMTYARGESTGEEDTNVAFIQQQGKIVYSETTESNLIINVTGTAIINILHITVEEIK
jgi:hypothetical protein